MPKKTLTTEEAKQKYEKHLASSRNRARQYYQKWKNENADVIAEWENFKNQRRTELLAQREVIEREIKSLRTNKVGTLKKFVAENKDKIRAKIQKGNATIVSV